MLSDGAAVEDVMSGSDGAVQGMARGALWVQMSTVGLPDLGRFIDIADYGHFGFVDAPVVGSKVPAEKGQLVILASGPDTLAPRVEPVFSVLGRKTLWLGSAGAGTRMKLVFNSWLTTSLAALAETIALAEVIGVDLEDLFALLADSPANMPYAHAKGRAMVEQDFQPKFALRLAEKDLNLVLREAEERELTLPVIESALKQYAQARAGGHGDDDIAAVYYSVREPGGPHRN
jgi:3-hydroxyisobutyrate dehydrogenase